MRQEWFQWFAMGVLHKRPSRIVRHWSLIQRRLSHELSNLH